MFIYEKNKKLYGTETTPSPNDSEVVYKDENGTTITLNQNDKYFDNCQGGITRQSDGKTVDILFNNKYVVPRGKEAPVPPVGPTVITWDGDTTGKETAVVDEFIYCKVSSLFSTDLSVYVGGTIIIVDSGEEQEPLEITEDNIEEVATGITRVSETLVVSEPTTIQEATLTPGTWFMKMDEPVVYVKKLSYGG